MKPPPVTNKQIGRLRKKMTEELDIYGVFTSPELRNLPETLTYADFRRVENERQLEAIKSHLAGYIFNENVTVYGCDLEKNGGRVVKLEHFDVMMKAMNMFLSAMNMQNKIWGLYAAPDGKPQADPLPPKNLSASLLSEMRKLAIKDKLTLPVGEPRAINSRPSNPDL